MLDPPLVNFHLPIPIFSTFRFVHFHSHGSESGTSKKKLNCSIAINRSFSNIKRWAFSGTMHLWSFIFSLWESVYERISKGSAITCCPPTKMRTKNREALICAADKFIYFFPLSYTSYFHSVAGGDLCTRLSFLGDN